MERTLHVIGIDPGGTTGWFQVTVPRLSIYGDEPSRIIDVDYGEFSGNEVKQVDSICSLARMVQSLTYQVGPALVVEGWDHDPSKYRSLTHESFSPMRIGAMLQFAQHKKMMMDAQVCFQSRSQAKERFTDERLKHIGMYVKGSDHIQDAARHAFTALSRAKKNDQWRNEMWRYISPLYKDSER